MAPPDPADRRIALVVNTKSRRGKKLFEAALTQLQDKGWTAEPAEAVRNPRNLDRVIGGMIADGPRLIAVGGGDGTLAAAAALFANKAATMAVLPLGTANSFARSLGLAPTVEAAVAAIEAGRIEAVDIGEIAGVSFVSAATIGLPARIAKDIPSGYKKWLGRVGYALYGLGKFARLRPFVVRVEIAGQPPIIERVVEIRIGNGRFVGGVEAMPNAGVASADLVLQLVRGRYAAALAGVWAANIGGWRTPRGQVRELRAAAFTLSCHPEQPVSVDGEPSACTPARVRLLEGALKVIVPPGSDVG